jgi:hypothetical protein
MLALNTLPFRITVTHILILRIQHTKRRVPFKYGPGQVLIQETI